MTMPVTIASFATEARAFFREMVAAAFLGTIPVIAIFVLLGKHIVKGLSLGAIER